ncbi:LysR family transcriptional regulator [Pseudoduganella aquatica]|nr:LysR family transcriptional regulator [Pseudoduganella aquatica]
MQTFVRIVEANSFTKAAETLNLPRAALTATMQNLEAFLGTRLLQRTTRRLSLTPDGADYFRQCVDILGAVEAAEAGFRGASAGQPKGKLRIDLPGTLGRRMVMPRIGEFCAAYPEVELVLSLSDRIVDLVQEGIDCALRVGQLQDSSLVGRQIGSMRFLTCAAPGYLQRHGVPRTLDDLAAHKAVVHFSGRTGRAFDWDFQVGGKVVKADMAGAISVNDADAYLSCALQGMGLAQVGAYQARPHLQAGELVEVLQAWPPVPMPISLLYPQGRMAAPKLRVFADWLSSLFQQEADLQLWEV